MNINEALQKINEFQKNTITDVLGIEITDIGSDYICGKMPVDERTIQPFGLLHGGASAVLAESLGSIAGGMQVNRETQTVVGVEINCNHLRSARGGWVFGKATPIKIGRKIHVWNIEIKNDDGKLVAVSRLTLAVIDKK
ncbi:MAG: hotdog fold thioesterase [Candidatus Marinimicrobia bacterium]|jgi:1,4-dihydroxy-2-naphthoyl-CoA hydrolase|nr:hotdog fold thioesterase [Candidatus Neomarinimicrobiota bacterium]MBT4555102.1 hotdog fold thioesterase [Candidatus Neomarinimicrobiota bacterium]MBT4752627.1 hotdog fold thioesterase [Candidatus Neomarinimicrobiota bacterium]MBT5749122.1 hotdog fold thioesterase [Candidatus Neomarinimicrobiota bacterium]MBT7945806.1 hotdog fold thioesterase [Candidatus Neomarinimicrobiota bacterium]